MPEIDHGNLPFGTGFALIPPLVCPGLGRPKVYEVPADPEEKRIRWGDDLVGGSSSTILG